MRADIMTISRLLLVAAFAIIVGPAVTLAVPSAASASALTDGTYRFDYDGSKQPIDGVPKPAGAHSTLIAMRSACPPSGCVATGWDTSIGPTVGATTRGSRARLPREQRAVGGDQVEDVQ